jgi:hypothetical protein
LNNSCRRHLISPLSIRSFTFTIPAGNNEIIYQVVDEGVD